MLHATPASPTEVPQAPARIVTGLYLRCLREARGTTLEDAARAVGGSTSAVSRWERAESPIRKDVLQRLLARYGVMGKHADFLMLHMPPQSYSRNQRDEQGLARRAPHDCWADVAHGEATARYIAVMRMASEVTQFCMTVPAGLRTQAYEQIVLDPDVCATPDEPVLGLPSWVFKVPWDAGQRRTVLLDETVLTRGGSQSEVVAGQLRHLADLVSREKSGVRGPVVRILPMSPVVFVHSVGLHAEVTLHGHRLVTSIGLFPFYETGSGAAQAIGAGLREAVSAACSREETYDRLVHAADAMQRRATS
ncbi:Scr1 family TA system antitoxin-like transcriptional regulator [Streptomyces nigrescens]|uniref:Scr1 family TA system antitoxin-like transcriptional regulator n=1 Tax=Streptomyces nigrescens TaxID=1920 RepID=UPI0036A475D3